MICVICGNEVSKRQSLAYKDGRACRDHEEVKKMQMDALEKSSWAKAERNLSKICLVEACRVQLTQGVPYCLVEDNLRRVCKKDYELYDEVMDEVRKRGKLSAQEIRDAMMIAVVMAKDFNPGVADE